MIGLGSDKKSVPAGMITGLIGIFAHSVVTSQAKVIVKRTLKRVVKRILWRIVDLYNALFFWDSFC